MLLYCWRYIVPDAIHYTENPPYYRCEKVIDFAKSVVWCERYQEPGEMRIVLPASKDLLAFFWDLDIILTRDDSDRAMMVEALEMTTSAENGDYITLTGRSAEAYPAQRTILQRDASVEMNAVAMIHYYMRENIAGYWYENTDAEHQHGISNPDCRRFMNVLVHGSDEMITETVSAEPFGKNLSEFITEVCKGADIGFKIVFDADTHKLVYSCYRGKDRTLNQSERNPVVFSEEFGGIGSSTYTISKRTYYSHVVAGGSGQGSTRMYGEAWKNFRAIPGVGANLRESFINASGVSDGMLRYEAQNAMLAANRTQAFEVVPESSGQFRYRRDYFLGDKVSCVNKYGVSGTAAVSEVTETEDANGFYTIPTLTRFDDAEYLAPARPDKPEPPPPPEQFDETKINMAVMVDGEREGTIYKFDTLNEATAFMRDNYLVDFWVYIGSDAGVTVVDPNPSLYVGRTNLVRISFPSTLEEVGLNGPQQCENLKRADYPAAIDGNEISYATFWDCAGLEELYLPGNVTEIKNRAFAGLLSLRFAAIAGEPPIDGVFVIPSSVALIGESAFEQCSLIRRFVIPQGVTTIKTKAFRKCVSLETITIPSSVTTLVGTAFDGCTSLETIIVEKAKDSLPGAPWSAPNATVVWTG